MHAIVSLLELEHGTKGQNVNTTCKSKDKGTIPEMMEFHRHSTHDTLTSTAKLNSYIVIIPLPTNQWTIFLHPCGSAYSRKMEEQCFILEQGTISPRSLNGRFFVSFLFYISKSCSLILIQLPFSFQIFPHLILALFFSSFYFSFLLPSHSLTTSSLHTKLILFYVSYQLQPIFPTYNA